MVEFVRHCLQCHTEIEGKSTKKYCSQHCANKFNRLKTLDKRKIEKRKWDIENIEWKRQYENERLKVNKDLRSYRKKYLKNYKRPYILKKNFGISEEQWNQLRKQQNYQCAICGITEEENKKNLAIDHDHSTGEIRGLLCSNCNAGIGFLKDSPEYINKAYKYLTDCKTGWFVPDKDIGDEDID